MNPAVRQGPAGAIARAFIGSTLTPLLIVGSVLAGLVAIVALPREEEPQIKVPVIDISAAMPGASAAEIESRVSSPLERLAWEIDGVDYVYSISQPGRALVTVRFKVGDDPERSLVKLQRALQAHVDRMPPAISPPLVRARTIDDVPILALTFHAQRYDHLALRRLAAQVDAEIKHVPQVSETTLIGGYRRQVRVRLDPPALAARGLGVAGVLRALAAANHQETAGAVTSDDRDVIVETGAFFASADDVAATVVGVHGGVPVALRDVARVEDGAEEPTQYALFGTGAAVSRAADEQAAVTLSVAKRPGSNAVAVSQAVLAQVDRLKGTVIPADVSVAVTRHYGASAAEKSNELLLHMAVAIVGVSLLVLFMLGWRESAVVAVAIPSTLSLMLLLFHLMGYTLNRVTLFALIFSIGILVDDAIVVVENIVRHRALDPTGRLSLREIAVRAVAEVGNPTVLATLTVIAAILPMAFVGGLSGPYLRPIPVGASAAMVFSLLVAFAISPWAAARLLGTRRAGDGDRHGDSRESRATRAYRWLMSHLVGSRTWRWSFLGLIVTLLVAAAAFVPAGWVRVKMLPFDNKSELELVLNMPEDSSLERTARVARELAAAVREEKEVTDYQIYVGTAAPYSFNGLMRHYDLRRGPSVAEIQVNLLPKEKRRVQSHAFAQRIRPAVAAIAARYGARVAVAEVPPGPPVLQSLVAEVYGPDEAARQRLAESMRRLMTRTPGVVDVDSSLEAPHPKELLTVDKEKAALHGIAAEAVARTLQIALSGAPAGLLHAPRDQEPVEIVVDVPAAQRARVSDLLSIRVPDGAGRALVPLGELVRQRSTVEQRSIHHKNLLPVVYVMGDVAGGAESPAYAILEMNKAIRAFAEPVAIYNATQPSSDARPAIKWDGEWDVTLELFSDLGAACAVVILLIYGLLVGWFRSFTVPLVVMVPIPFSLVGVLPAHAALGAFFTATSLIGFMAGAGIVVRNSIILVDFAEQRIREGMSVEQAVVDAGAVRFRPMLLTALAVIVGSAMILFDPIFQGLALSLAAGEVASLLISRLAVPVLYAMVRRQPSPAVLPAGETRRGTAAIAVGVGLIVLGVSTAPHAQTIVRKAPRTMTVEDAVQLALTQNPQLQAARLRVRAATDVGASVGRRMLPRIYLSEELQYYDSPFAISFGPPPAPGVLVREQQTNIFVAAVAQPLLGLLKLDSSRRQAIESTAAASAQLAVAEADLRHAVQAQYLAIFQAQSMQQIAQASEEQLREQLTAAEARLRSGVLTTADLLRIQVAVANAHQQALQAQSLARVAHASLMSLIGLGVGGGDVVLGEPRALLAAAREAPRPLAGLLAVARERRSELAQQDHLRLAAEHEARAHTYALLPDVNLEGAYLHTNGSLFAPRDAAFVGLKATWSLWEWGATNLQRTAAESRAAAARVEATGVQRQVELELSTSLAQGAAAHGAVDSAQQVVASAEEAYRVTAAQTKSGAATTTDLLAAQAALTQARLNLTRAEYELALAYVVLLRAVGS